MKIVLIIISVAMATAQETYDFKLDTLDSDFAFSNSLIMDTFVNCFLDKAPCDYLAGRVKTVIADSFLDACAKCSARQKHHANNFFKAFLKRSPEELVEFKKKYVPEGSYYDDFVAAISNA